MSDERDTKFAGFAELLLQELQPDLAMLFVALGSPLKSSDQEVRVAENIIARVIAQRAYDLAVHIVDAVRETMLPESIVDDIPDLTEWPTTSKQNP